MPTMHPIAMLAMKYNTGTLTSEEAVELDKLITSSSENKMLFELFTNQDFIKEKLGSMAGFDQEEHWKMIEKRYAEKMLDQGVEPIRPVEPVKKVPIKSNGWRRFAVAASVLLLISFGVYIYIKPYSPKKANETLAEANDIPGAPKKATLKLEDGSTVLLDSIASNMDTQQRNCRIINDTGGLITYLPQSSNLPIDTITRYNTLITPLAGKFRVTLSDGSRLWLSPGTSITYPVCFSGLERQVILERGEVYFDVAENKNLPFRVQVADGMVQALGTEFNVRTYPDEDQAKVTLTEGAVKVFRASDSVLLKPGEQAVISKKDGMNKRTDVNVHKTIAWKNDRLNFIGDDCSTAMKQIKKWYGMEAVYPTGEIPAGRSEASYLTNTKLGEILKNFEIQFHAHIVVKDNKIFITPKTTRY